jgi:hypothetical protein
MKHKIVLDKHGYLLLYKKQNWYSPWEYMTISSNDTFGRNKLERDIRENFVKEVIVATYTNGKEDVTSVHPDDYFPL